MSIVGTRPPLISETNLYEPRHKVRGLFKGTEPTKYIALAYLTGILPIKKMKTQSALNNFDEFTMLSASNMAPYVGFTESEDACKKISSELRKGQKVV